MLITHRTREADPQLSASSGWAALTAANPVGSRLATVVVAKATAGVSYWRLRRGATLNLNIYRAFWNDRYTILGVVHM